MATSRKTTLETVFPGLRDSSYAITSAPSVDYNCIAWAAEDSGRWWEPDPLLIYDWPPNVPRDDTIAAYVDAFRALGYELCESPAHEPGVQKVALFVKDGLPTHAARQTDEGRWTSKCGQLDDIVHELTALEGEHYGTVAVILARPAP